LRDGTDADMAGAFDHQKVATLSAIGNPPALPGDL
jgi:hypothetical protein